MENKVKSGPLRIRLLGGASARWSSGQDVAFPTRKSLGLLAYLAMNAPRRVSRSALANLYWADSAEADARASLRRSLHELTSALGESANRVMEVDRDGVALSAGEVIVDALEFERMNRAGDLPSLRVARDLYGGRFLQDFRIDTEELEIWQSAEAVRLEDLALQGLARLSEQALRTGKTAEALDSSAKLLEMDPLHEEGCRLHIRSLAASGRRAEALRRCDAFVARLETELSASPEEQTIELYEHVRRGQEMLPEPSPGRPDIPSIVVLPLENLSETNTHDFVASALTENLTAELSRDRSLFVIARNSAAVYENRVLSAPEIAADLGVRYLLLGSVQLEGKQCRVNVQLVDGDDGDHTWAGRYEKPFTRLLEVQDAIGSQIVSTLRGYKGVVQRAELKRSLSKPDIDLSTYELLMRGMAHKEKFLRDDMLIARGYFERAIDRWPDFAMAHGWLAWTWFFDVYMGWVEDPRPSLAKTFQSAQEAVRLDPDLDFAHWAMGAAHLAAGDLGNSLRSFDKALELNPNNSDALANSAWPLTFSGRPDKAMNNINTAMRLNPYYPDWYLWGMGIAEYSREAYGRAAEALERMSRPNAQSHAFLAASLHRLGRKGRAHRIAKEILHIDPQFDGMKMICGLAYTDGRVPDLLADDFVKLDLVKHG